MTRRWRGLHIVAAGLVLALAGCVAAPPQWSSASRTGVIVAPPRGEAASPGQCGFASWYAMTSLTASGERANPNAMTAAHRSLPFGTRVEVTNLANGRSATVRVNDRGPFIAGRIIDVTKAAAAKLGFVAQGTARVRIRADGIGGASCS